MSTYTNSIDADVIIIGAGISGMMAAFTLIEKEPTLNVLILEASDRIGGRVLSVPVLSGSGHEALYDIGGQWISQQQCQLIKLLDKLNISLIDTKKQHGKTIYTYKDSTQNNNVRDLLDFCNRIDKYQIVSFIEKIEHMCRNISFHTSLDENSKFAKLKRMSMDSFINCNIKGEHARNIIKYIIETHIGCCPEKITVLFYLFYCSTTRGISNQFYNTNGHLYDCLIQNGAQSICHKLAEIIEEIYIIKNESVIRVRQDLNFTEVKTNKQIYRSYHVIAAIPPPAILNIEFCPQLNHKKCDILKRHVKGKLVKFVATYKKEFWKRQGLCGDLFVNNNDLHLCCLNITTLKGAALTGYIYSPNRRTKQYKKIVLNHLKSYFGEDALYPIGYIEKTWRGGPMICYEIFEPLELQDIRSSDGRIFWAGAEMATEWYGTIAGAVQAGNRAAVEVLYYLRPALLTKEDMSCITIDLHKRRTGSYDHFIYKKVLKWHYMTPICLLIFYVMYKAWRRGHLKTLKSFIKTFLIKYFYANNNE